MVHATAADLDIIAAALDVLNAAPPPQIDIKTKFVEIDEARSHSSGFDLHPDTVILKTNAPAVHPSNLGDMKLPMTNSVLAQITAVLTAEQYRLVIDALEKRDGLAVSNHRDDKFPEARVTAVPQRLQAAACVEKFRLVAHRAQLWATQATLESAAKRLSARFALK